jgi:chromosome segregation ATPase
MARAETLELLGSLIDSLEPLGNMSPGRPIRAADWNRLVEAVRTVARVTVARERTTDEFLDDRYARSEHNHIGQIALSWFDPSTRALLDENVSGAVEQRAGLKQVRDEVAQLRGTLQDLDRKLNELRVDLDGLRDSDSAREREVGRVASRVESLRDVEVRVAGLDDRLVSIGTNLESALAFRNELIDETGRAINVRAFGQRITELETLRQNLTTASGNLVQIREIERTIARLEENAIGRRDIDDAVAARLRDRDALQQSGLIDAVRGEVEAALQPRFVAIDENASRIAGEVAGLRGTVTGQDGRLQQHDTRISAAQGQIDSLVALPDRVNQQQTRITEMETRIQANQAAISDLPAIRAQLGQLRTDVTTLAGLGTTLNQLEGRVRAVEANAATIDQLFARTENIAQRIGTLEAGFPALQQMTATVAQHAASLAQLNARVIASEARLDTLAELPRTTDTLSAQMRDFLQFQATTSQRLNELTTRTANLGALGERLTAIERLGAENRNSILRMVDDVGSIRNRVDRIENRPPRPDQPIRPTG